MYANHPTFRWVLYIIALVAQVASFFVRAADPGGVWAQAVQDTADFLGGIGLVTAASNVSGPTLTKVARWRLNRRERPRRV